MDRNRSPVDENGDKIELHHIGQTEDSPLAELRFEEHRGKDTYNILHKDTDESSIDRQNFNKVREAHWKSRSKDL